MLIPRPYQIAAIEAIKAGTCAGARSQVIVLPTGTGKTATALMLAKDCGPPVLWLAHRDELIQQAAGAIRHVWPSATTGIVKAGMDEHHTDVVFASIQTACRDRRLEQLTKRRWRLVVVDECHHAPSATWRRVVEGVGCLTGDGPPPPIVGLTATPERLDSARLDDLFSRAAYQYHLHQAIADGYLVKPDIVFEPIKIDLDSVHTQGGDLAIGELDLALLEGGIIDAIRKAVKTHAANRKTLIFVVSVRQAQMVAEALRADGHRAGSVDGSMPTVQRRGALRAFKSGEINVLANCAILTEGFDEPSISCIVMARPTKSKSLYIQCVGRGLRLFPGKTNCRVLDMVALSKRHSLVQAPVIFGAEVKPPERKTQQPLFEADPIEYWRQRLSAQVLGLESISRSDMRWIRGNAGELLLGVGNFGTVRLQPASDDTWSCDVIGNRETGRDLEPLADGPIDLELAQGLGEDYVRRCKAVVLARGGRWKDQPATEAQLEALRKWRITPPGGLTKGQASDMLTQAAARQYEPATHKQKWLLRQLGVEFDGDITKREAGKLIGRMKGNAA